MKYYAVTDDINELYHYGVKGMQWGKHLFGKEKSPGYKKASSKLRNIIKSARKDIEARRSYKNQVEKAIKRTQLSQQKYGWDQISDGMKNNEKAMRNAQKSLRKAEKHDRIMESNQVKENNRMQKYQLQLAKNTAKQAKIAAKAEKHFDKYLQEAREGRLRAGKLSEDQISRINSRLALERTSRQLGNTEKAKFRTRMKEAVQEGLLQGTTRGMAAGIEEVARAKVQTKMANKRVLDKKAKQEGIRQRNKDFEQNKKTHKQMKRKLREEAYQEQIRDQEWNSGILGKLSPTKRAAQRLDKIQTEKEHAKLNAQLQRDRYKNWLQKGQNEKPDDYQARIDNEIKTGAMRDAMSKISYYAPREEKKNSRAKVLKNKAKEHLANLASEIGSNDYEGMSSPINKKKRAYTKNLKKLTDNGAYDLYENNKSVINDLDVSSNESSKNYKRMTRKYTVPYVDYAKPESSNKMNSIYEQMTNPPKKTKPKK